MYWFLLTISLLADLASLIGIARMRGDESPIRRWGLPFLLVIMTALVTWQAFALQRFTTCRREAAALVDGWPEAWEIEYLPDGENIGIILGGLRFLEQHQDEYPETFFRARNLLESPLGHVQLNGAEPRDSHELAETAAAMVRLVGSVAGE